MAIDLPALAPNSDGDTTPCLSSDCASNKITRTSIQPSADKWVPCKLLKSYKSQATIKCLVRNSASVLIFMEPLRELIIAE